MPNDLNNCQFTGRLGKEVETRYSAAGMAVSKLSMAVGSTRKDKNSGEKKEKTVWVDVVAFGNLAEIMGEYLRKGSKVLITGEYSVSKWQDDQGNNRQRTEIIANYMQMLDTRPAQSNANSSHVTTTQQQGGASNGASASQYQNATGGAHRQPPPPQPADFGDFDDDIPF